MTRLIDAEFFKMRKRLMTWVCALVLVGLILLLYWVLWDASGEATKRLGNSRFFQQDLRRVHLPQCHPLSNPSPQFATK